MRPITTASVHNSCIFHAFATTGMTQVHTNRISMRSKINACANVITEFDTSTALGIIIHSYYGCSEEKLLLTLT